MQLKTVLIPLVTLSGLLFTAFAGAHEGHPGPHAGMLHPHDYLLLLLAGVGILAGLRAGRR